MMKSVSKISTKMIGLLYSIPISQPWTYGLFKVHTVEKSICHQQLFFVISEYNVSTTKYVFHDMGIIIINCHLPKMMM